METFDDSDVNALVLYLSTRKEPQTQHVACVMELTRRLAKYEHDLDQSRNETRKARDEMAMLADPLRYGGPRDRYPREPGYPQVIELPVNTRSVEIKL